MTTSPAKPKPSPDPRRFSVGALLEAHYSRPDDWQTRQAGEDSTRAVEVVMAARPADVWTQRAAQNGVIVPDELLVRSMGLPSGGAIQAAITTRSAAAGVDDAMVAYDSVIGQLVAQGEVMPHCRIRSGLEPPEVLPQVNFARGAFGTVPENTRPAADVAIGTLGANLGAGATATTLTLAAAASQLVRVDDYLVVGSERMLVTAVASQTSFTVDRAQEGTARRAHASGAAVTLATKSPSTLTALASAQRTLTPHTLRGHFTYTPEVRVGTRMRIGVIGVDEGIRLMAEQVENEIARGTGTGGQVTGFETYLSASNSRRITTPLNDASLYDIKEIWYDATVAGVPVNGRFWAVSPAMSRYLYGGMRGGQPGSVRELMGDVAIVESGRITESAFSAPGRRGVAWLLQGNDITVGFFGEDTEVSVQRVNATGDWDVVMLKFWDVAFRRPEAVRRFLVEDA